MSERGNMKKETEKEDSLIERFYENLGRIIEARGIRWKDLAMLIGISSNTLSSMKAQRVNPSLTRIVKIAETLEVSVDELIGNRNASQGLYDIFWRTPKVIKSVEKQDQICANISQIIDAASDSGDFHAGDRNIVCSRLVQNKLEDAIHDMEIKKEKEKG